MTIPGTSEIGTYRRTLITNMRGKKPGLWPPPPQDLATILKQIEGLIRLL